jgi:hypothetical protein
MFKNFVQQDRPHMIIWRMHIACWISTPTDTHSEYVIRTAFPQQQWMHERPSILRYSTFFLITEILFLFLQLRIIICRMNSCMWMREWEGCGRGVLIYHPKCLKITIKILSPSPWVRPRIKSGNPRRQYTVTPYLSGINIWIQTKMIIISLLIL